MVKPDFMSDPLTEVVYCVHKRGEYDFSDDFNTARLFAECETLTDLKNMMVLVQLSKQKGLVDEEELRSFESLTGLALPVPDRMLKWPWDERYEAP